MGLSTMSRARSVLDLLRLHHPTSATPSSVKSHTSGLIAGDGYFLATEQVDRDRPRIIVDDAFTPRR